MANVTRYNVNALDSVFDDLMRGFFVRPVRFENENAVPAQIRVDVSENDRNYVVRAEIPGVRKEDINVSIEGNQVEISAEVKNEKEIKEGEKVLRSERYYGKVYRGFTLGQEVDQNATQARYADGILELTLPKKAPAANKRINIQ
ncbi:MAG TPA: Hsp20/alpha crystallin family protein [Burkholderiales bacterium]|nr:Hsp20/alpha crystallin family protein [Burkholderiales bacterium]